MRKQQRSSSMAALGLLVLVASHGIIIDVAHATEAKNGTEAMAVSAEKKLASHLKDLAAQVASVNSLVGKNPDPLLLASHLPFLESSCASDSEAEDEFGNGSTVAEKMRHVGRFLMEKKASPEIEKFLQDAAGYWADVLKSIDPVRRIKNDLENPDNYFNSKTSEDPEVRARGGKSFSGSYGVDFPKTGNEKLDAFSDKYSLNVPYELWTPTKETFNPLNLRNPYKAWLLVVNLIENVYLRWYVDNAKCDFKLPTLKPTMQPAEVVCTRPKVKVSYCLKFKLRTPLVQPSVPLCIPEDVMNVLWNVGPILGGVVVDGMNQISPYLLPLLEDYIRLGGTQEQLFEAAGLLFSDLPSGGDLGIQALVSLLGSPGIEVLLDGVDIGQLVLGTGFKGMLSTLIDSQLAPPALQPLLEQTGPYLPYIISNYYGCGGETNAFFDAINSVLTNPLVEPFLNDPSALQSSASDPALLGAVFPALYASVITNNPPMYNWLVTLPNQCIVDQGYIQPVAVILTQGTMFETIGANLPKLADDYYNAGCTTEQLLAYAPVMLEAFNLPTAEQTNALFQKFGTTPSGEQVGFTQPFNGGPSILQCVTPNLAYLTTVLAVGK